MEYGNDFKADYDYENEDEDLFIDEKGGIR